MTKLNDYNPLKELERELRKTGVIGEDFKSYLFMMARECLSHGYTRGLRAAAKMAEERGAKVTAEEILKCSNPEFAD